MLPQKATNIILPPRENSWDQSGQHRLQLLHDKFEANSS